jgi:purine-binding chemotaxis protein CheW
MLNAFVNDAYLTFLLGNEKFAVHVNNVQEVVELNEITKVPNTPDYMLGIINLRGRVLPLLDTRLKLGLPAAQRTSKNRILILEITDGDEKMMQVGAIVDVAREVVEINVQQIQKTADMDNYKHSTPVTGIVNNQGDITMIIDINKVFISTDISGMADIIRG